MSTIAEIETAIECLTTSQVEELAIWLEALRARRASALAAEAWLKRRGSRASGRDDGRRDGPHSW